MGKNDKPKSKEPKDGKSKSREPKDTKPEDGKDSAKEKANPKTLENKPRGDLELDLQQTLKWKNSLPVRIVIILISLFGALLIEIEFLGVNFESSPVTGVFLFAAIAIIIGCMLFIYVNLFSYFSENTIRRQMLDDDINRIQNETKEDIFENSIRMSYKYLDQYYLQTREHAQQGFMICAIASVCGFILVCFGIRFMLSGQVSSSYITCGAGTIIEFISAVFFYLYNKTVISMSNYHNKLVLSHNVSIALRVAESLPQEEKVEAKRAIIHELIKDFNIHLAKDNGKSETNA